MKTGITYHVSSGEVVIGNIVIKAENKGTTKPRAENNMLKSLCNKLRSSVEKRNHWIEWKNLTSEEQDEWLNNVRQNLKWTNISCSESRMGKVSSNEFYQAVEKGWV